MLPGGSRFQPFGYHFEIISSLAPSEAKLVMRRQMKGWFDVQRGARGWIAGPFMCLWLSVYDKQGPMVLARITDDSLGSRIHGRAGSDLNGMIMLAFLTAGMIFIAIQMFRQEQRMPSILPIAFFVLLIPLAFWFAHKDRKDAEPLVRFIERAVGSSRSVMTRALSLPPLDDAPVHGARLFIDGDKMGAPPSARDVGQAILAMEPDNFLMLEFAPEIYMQTLLEPHGFILEKRDGGSDRHFRARERFDHVEVVEVMTAYLLGRSPSQDVVWERIGPKPGDGESNATAVAYAIGAMFVVIVIVLFWMKVR